MTGDAVVCAADESHEHYRRASGEMPCRDCGKKYREHKHAAYEDWQGEPWLVRLCNGELVKL